MKRVLAFALFISGLLSGCEGGSLGPAKDSVILAVVTGPPRSITGQPHPNADVRPDILAAARERLPGRTIRPDDIVNVSCAKGFKDVYFANAISPPGTSLAPGDIVALRVGTPQAFIRPSDFDVILGKVQDPNIPGPELRLYQDGRAVTYPAAVMANYVESSMGLWRIACWARDRERLAAPFTSR